MAKRIETGGETIRISPIDNKVLESSSDGGKTWAIRYAGNAKVGEFQDLTDKGMYLYAITNNDEFFSTNNGKNWNSCDYWTLHDTICFTKDLSEDIFNKIHPTYCLDEIKRFIDIEKLQCLISGANNTLIAFGMGAGNNRIKEALEEAFRNCLAHVWATYDFYSAKEVVLQIADAQTDVLTDNQYKVIQEYIRLFSASSIIHQSCVKDASILDDQAVVRIIAINMKEEST